jgi:hypothetical protein
MGISMINRTFVESSIENIEKIKEELKKIKEGEIKQIINDNPDFDINTPIYVYMCDYDIEDISNTKIKLSCGGKCPGHEDEILKILEDIKIVSQHIDIDSDNFYICYYSQNNQFSCYFDFNSNSDYGINYNYVNKLTTEQINILYKENIFSIVNGEYVNNEKFPFCRKTTSIYCNVCKDHHDSKFKCIHNEDFPYNQKNEMCKSKQIFYNQIITRRCIS